MPTNIATLDDRRKKLYFRSCHRGIKKWILYSPNLPNKFSLILMTKNWMIMNGFELSDTDLFAWSTGRQELPDALRSPLLDKLFKPQTYDLKLSTQSIELNKIIDNPPQSFSGWQMGMMRSF